MLRLIIKNIIIFICLNICLVSCKNKEQNRNIKISMKETSLLSKNIKNNNSGIKALNSYDKQDQKVIDLLSNIPIETYEHADYYPENGDTTLDNTKENIFILSQSEDKSILVYGYENSNYERQGIIINYKVNAEEHYSYFNFTWEPYYRKPSIFIYDYDNDGQEEIALCLQEATGTGINIQQLIIFETFDDGHLDAYKFTSEEQISEVTRLVNYKVDKKNCIVNLINNRTKETGILDISFKEAGKNISIEDVDYSSQITFSIDDKIIMNIYPGLRIKEQFSTYFDESKEQVLKFYVNYDYSKSLHKGYFSLKPVDF